MKRILYLMHIPWGWIKQRPHFFAEYLSEDCCIDVCYRKSNTVSRKKLLTSKDVEKKNLSIRGFNNIPFDKIPFIKKLKCNWINSLIAYVQLPELKKYDYIWITAPMLYPIIKPFIGKQRVVYDCMDDMVEFPDVKNNSKLKEKILRAEKELLMMSDVVLVSSQYLKDKIQTRSGVKREKVFVVNNAIELPKVDEKLSNDIIQKISFVKNLSFPFMYVGMVSEWFDFDLILKILERFPEINIVLLGPCDTKVVEHDRIHYLGTVERKYIFSLMNEAYALIMPFVLNELIYSVNPVKLYEYIYTGKPVVAVKYGETEKFEGFAHLYNTYDEFCSIILRLLENTQENTKSRNEIEQYMAENTWKARYNQVKSLLQL